MAVPLLFILLAAVKQEVVKRHNYVIRVECLLWVIKVNALDCLH